MSCSSVSHVTPGRPWLVQDERCGTNTAFMDRRDEAVLGEAMTVISKRLLRLAGWVRKARIDWFVISLAGTLLAAISPALSRRQRTGFSRRRDHGDRYPFLSARRPTLPRRHTEWGDALATACVRRLHNIHPVSVDWAGFGRRTVHLCPAIHDLVLDCTDIGVNTIPATLDNVAEQDRTGHVAKRDPLLFAMIHAYETACSTSVASGRSRYSFWCHSSWDIFCDPGLGNG